MSYIFCFQCTPTRFLKEFSVPANTVLDGKLFQLFVTLLVKNKMYILISKNCLLM